MAARDYRHLRARHLINNQSFSSACRCADREREQESDEQAARRLKMPVGLFRHLRERKRGA